MINFGFIGGKVNLRLEYLMKKRFILFERRKQKNEKERNHIPSY